MRIVSRESGEEFEAVIERATNADLIRVKRQRKFTFDWSVYLDSEVYKLTLAGQAEILGLIAIEQHPNQGFRFVEAKTIELLKENIGAGKKLDNVAGCLIAYVCQIAIDNGFEGFVRIDPKTVLYNHYIKKYGFMPFTRRYLYSNYETSNKLIDQYLK